MPPFPAPRWKSVRTAPESRPHTISSDAGLYVFPNLPTGIWTVTAEKPGFKKLVRTGIEIFIAQRQALDLKLEVGDVKQTVEVAANQTLLETETSEKGQTLTPKMYQTLPLWSGGLQNPSAFLGYMASVNTGGETEHRRVDRPRARAADRRHQQRDPGIGRHGFQSAFGRSVQRGQVDCRQLIPRNTGASAAESRSSPPGPAPTVSTAPGLTACGATSGKRPAGASIRTANNAPGFRPKDRLNATSGGVGGPVWIPKVYNGRNKTFFYFTSDNDLRPVAPASIVNTVPTEPDDEGRFQPDSAGDLRSGDHRRLGSLGHADAVPEQHDSDQPVQQDLVQHHSRSFPRPPARRSPTITLSSTPRR